MATTDVSPITPAAPVAADVFVMHNNSAGWVTTTPVLMFGSGTTGQIPSYAASGLLTPITLGTGVSTLLSGTPSGTGGLVGKTSPTLTTPNIGAATGTSLALTKFGKLGGVIFKDYTDVGNVALTGETTAYQHTVASGTLNANGDSVTWEIAGSNAGDLSVGRRIRVYQVDGENGDLLRYDSGVFTLSALSDWLLKFSMIRDGSTTQRVRAELSIANASGANLVDYGAYSGASNITAFGLKLTLESTGGAKANNDIVATVSEMTIRPAP